MRKKRENLSRRKERRERSPRSTRGACRIMGVVAPSLCSLELFMLSTKKGISVGVFDVNCLIKEAHVVSTMDRIGYAEKREGCGKERIILRKLNIN